MNRWIRWIKYGAMLVALTTAAPLAGAFEAADGVEIELGTTVVGQATSERNGAIDKPATASVDILADVEVGSGTLHLYAEGATTADVSAASIVAGSNADAGTAADANGRGRLQVSELFYALENGAYHTNLGLIDLTGFADTSATANDEAVQFLADGLVNNPTIAFPDYTPAVVLGYSPAGEAQWVAAIANAYGLGDNAGADYGDLIDFGTTPAGLQKGLFGLVEMRTPGLVDNVLLTLGGWYSSSELVRFDGLGTETGTFGLYANVDARLASDTTLSGRLGWNSGQRTFETDLFASLAVEHAYGDANIIGLGAAYEVRTDAFKRTFATPQVPGNPLVTELYYRWQVNDYVALSPSVQYWNNPNGLSAGGPADVAGSVWVYGLRFQLTI